MSTPAATTYPLAPLFVARFVGLGLVALAVLMFVGTTAVALTGAPPDILVGLVLVGLAGVFALAWWLRRETPGAPSGLPLVLEVIGVLGALVTGWLGGELVDRLGVGVDRGRISIRRARSPAGRHGRRAS